MKWSIPYVLVAIAGLVYQLSEGQRVHAQSQVVIDSQAAATKSDSPCLDNSKRFADCGNGTVTDQVTGLIWLQRANCTAMPGTEGSNLTNWPAAMAGVAALGDGLCGLADGSQSGEWRLPTEEEWEATIGYARDGLLCSGGLFPVFPNDSGTGCHNIVAPGYFIGLFSNSYWSSTVDESLTSLALIADLEDGPTDAGVAKADMAHIWPVRGGH